MKPLKNSSAQIDSYKQRADYTFKYNKDFGRHGWLRLTPAYSVKLVKTILSEIPSNSVILDPFSGTGTTGLVAAEHGNVAYGFDINPFLIWMGNIKCKNYTSLYLNNVWEKVQHAVYSCQNRMNDNNWIPPIYNIERWWSSHTLLILSALRSSLVQEFGEPSDNMDDGLAWVAFCRLIIETSSAAFNHVSMSFSETVETYEIDYVINLYLELLKYVIESCRTQLLGKAQILHVNSTTISKLETPADIVITSPPYPNRISYVRELRPYMYWTKFLETAKDAGELDWQAVGGTWGTATSRLNDWQPNIKDLPESLIKTVNGIKATNEKNSNTLGTYVFKYFHDMQEHLLSLKNVLNDGATLHYIVGNSTFYGVRVDTDKLLMESMSILGYKNISSEIIRKRNCNKALYEYCVTARFE